MRKCIRPAFEDRRGSVDLFDADRKNEEGGMFCVAPAILAQEVNAQWDYYVYWESPEGPEDGRHTRRTDRR